MKSAEARLLRTSSSLPGKLQLTSPLPSQSKRGPTPSLSSAMNPSRETAATPMIVLPMILSFRSVIVHHYRFDPERPSESANHGRGERSRQRVDVRWTRLG
jgi:hypothetical protein